MAKVNAHLAATASALIFFCLLFAAGCSSKNEGSNSAPPPGSGGSGSAGMMSGGPGRMGGGPGGPGMRGGPGGPGMDRGPGAGAVAENATGEDIYQAKCRCHGTEGKGGRAPVLTGGAGKSDAELFKIIHDGKGKMPAFASQLSDDQIKRVATALKGFK